MDFALRLARSLGKFRHEVLRIPFAEFVAWIKYDRAECLGIERIEWSLSLIAQTVARSQGADVDVFDFLEMVPWCKFERPMPDDEAIARQIEMKTGTYLAQRKK